ncbi:MAG: CxxxxCH/CxxCH domain c-type cytochrome, partial [Desulfobacteria bacterium]
GNEAGNDCSGCHWHNQDNNIATVDGLMPLQCNACHGEATPTSGAPPVAPTAGNRIWPSTVDNYAVLSGLGNHRSRPASGVNLSSHDPFAATTAGCVECHTSTPGSGATHNQAGNDNAAMTNIATHNWYTGAVASWSGGGLAGAVVGGRVVDDSCSNIDCHGPYYGAPANQHKSATPTPYTRYWLNQTLWDCYTCHAYDGRTATARPAGADNTMSTGSHGRHVGVLQFACSRCHDVTGYSVASFTGKHKNGFVDWSFAGSPNPYAGVPVYSVGTGTAAPTDNNAGASHRAWGNCSNLYCHSAGHDNTAAAGYYRSVAWGSAAPVCSGCHGNAAYDNANIRYGMPDALDHANSHARHVVDNRFECSVCHSLTVTGSYLTRSRAIVGASNAYHVNGTMDVVFDGAVATGSYVGGTKTCNVSCHGSDTPVWGAPLTNGCLSCHSGTEQVYKPQNDYLTAGAPNPVDQVEYVYSGHGRSGGSYTGSGNLPAGFSNYTTAPVACYVCHSQAASHTTKSTNDPFRLGSTTDNTLGGFGGVGGLTGAWADNTDLLCLGCHGDATQRLGHDNAAKGTTATINAQTHARGITGTKYTWPGPNYPWKCVDCHDPHGDGKSGAERFMMIRSGINAPTGVGDTAPGSDVKSRPMRIDANVRSVTFNSILGYASGSYAAPGNGPTTWGPCEVCHTQTTAYSRTADNLGSHATRTNRCTTCHPHKAGFAPTACKGCHGPDGVATAARAPEVGQYWAAGGHGRFTTGSPSRPIECEDCHDTSYLTASDHKTDGSVTGGPPLNINTLLWPAKSPLNADTNPNQNTAHLVAGYIDIAATSREAIARKFDNQCSTACHTPGYHQHQMDNVPPGVMRFGDHGTKTNPKLFDWYVWDTSNPANYPTSFFSSRSAWIDSDIRSVAGMTDPTVNYGLCVSCHDPHGTAVTDTSSYPGLGTTNHMLRGNWLPPAGPGTFCNNAGCHG